MFQVPAGQIQEALQAQRVLLPNTYKKVQFPEATITPIEGNGFVWHKGSSESSTIRFSSKTATDPELASTGTLKSISVDGTLLEEGTQYKATDGSVKIEFTKSYLETLGVGKHNVVATFKSYSKPVNATFTVAAKSSSDSSSKKSSSKPVDNVVTCQMAGYPANYAWNETAKACQPGYIDAGGNFHPYGTASRKASPRTSDTDMLIYAWLAMLAMTVATFCGVKLLHEDWEV